MARHRLSTCNGEVKASPLASCDRSLCFDLRHLTVRFVVR